MYVVDLANCDTLFMQNRSINLYLIVRIGELNIKYILANMCMPETDSQSLLLSSLLSSLRPSQTVIRSLELLWSALVPRQDPLS